MTTTTSIKQQIYQLIESLPVEQLPEVLDFVTDLTSMKVEPPAPIAPIYHIHHYAVDTGISDLAAQHDHYLYGVDKNDA